MNSMLLDVWNFFVVIAAGGAGAILWHTHWLIRLGRKAGGKEMKTTKGATRTRIAILLLSTSTGLVVGLAYWLWFVTDFATFPSNKVAALALISAFAGEGALTPLRKLAAFNGRLPAPAEDES